jgi:hypothetical protein
MDLIVVVLSGTTVVPSSALRFFRENNAAAVFVRSLIYFSWASHYITMQVLVNLCPVFIVKNWTGNSQEMTVCYNLRSHRLYNKKEIRKKKKLQ